MYVLSLSRSSVLGGSGVLWVTLQDGNPDPYGHMALQPYGVADWFNHFVHIAPLFIFDLYGRGVIPMIALVVLVNFFLMVQ